MLIKLGILYSYCLLHHSVSLEGRRFSSTPIIKYVYSSNLAISFIIFVILSKDNINKKNTCKLILSNTKTRTIFRMLMRLSNLRTWVKETNFTLVTFRAEFLSVNFLFFIYSFSIKRGRKYLVSDKNYILIGDIYLSNQNIILVMHSADA